MSNLLKNITVRVVGVSFQNEDGTDRQEILSQLSIGEAMLLKYYEYDNEPAYAVTDAVGNQIGNLPKDLSADIYEKYRDCYFSVQIENITGGNDELKYGCVIDIDIFDTVPSVVKQNVLLDDTTAKSSTLQVSSSTLQKKQYSDTAYSICGILLIVCGIILALIGLFLLSISLIGGLIAVIFGVLSFINGRYYRKIVKEHRVANK